MNTFGKINWIEYYGGQQYYDGRRLSDKLLEQNPCTACSRGPNGADNCTHPINPDLVTSCWKFTVWMRKIWPVVTGKAANPLCKNEKAAKVK